MMPSSALVLLDLQNDFLHSDGAYGRAGQSSSDIAALPARLKPLAELFHNKGAPGRCDAVYAGAGQGR